MCSDCHTPHHNLAADDPRSSIHPDNLPATCGASGCHSAAQVSNASFLTFSDPDGNGWVLQEITTRFPGRIADDATSFASASDLADAMRRAEAAHGEHEKRTGVADPNWPAWYAAFMVAEQTGAPPPA